MKNILILIPTLSSGGTEKQATILANLLSQENKIFFVIFYGNTISAKDNIERLDNANIKTLFVKDTNILQKVKKLCSIIKKYDINIAFNYLTLCDFIGSIIEKKCGVEFIYNGIRNSKLPFFKEILERFVHNYISSATIFNCYSGESYFSKRGFRKSKNIVISNCFPNIEQYIERTNTKVKRIITVGRFVPQKDYLTAIKTISFVKKHRKDFVFQIVGHGKLKTRILKWIEEYGIKDITELYVNPKNVDELEKSSDIYLSTSLFEGTSNSIMEALNYSLPVVCTDVGDNKYLVKNQINGFVCKSKAYIELGNSILRLLEDESLRKQQGLHGHRLLEQEFSADIFFQKHRALT